MSHVSHHVKGLKKLLRHYHWFVPRVFCSKCNNMVTPAHTNSAYLLPDHRIRFAWEGGSTKLLVVVHHVHSKFGLVGWQPKHKDGGCKPVPKVLKTKPEGDHSTKRPKVRPPFESLA